MSDDMSLKEFDAKLAESYQNRTRISQRGGPVYHDPESDPLIWYDQVLERELTPTGSLVCTHTMRVGKTQNALDFILVGSNQNTGKVTAAKGATITIKTLQSDTEDGTYEAVGPSLCVTAPNEGISAEKNALFCRVAIGNFHKPWLKISLEFTGVITGGTLDAALGYVPR